MRVSMIGYARRLSRSGASPSALRRRECVIRSAALSRLVARAQVSLWLLLTSELCQKQWILWWCWCEMVCWMYRFFSRGGGRTRWGSVMLSWWFLLFSVCVITRVPELVRRSRFLLCLYNVGPALQPKGGEIVYLLSRRIIDPWEPASNLGAAPVVQIRVVRYKFLTISPYKILLH